MAHSLGNVVASSMIQDYGLQVSKYLMCNSAVPAEAYDMTLTPTNVLVHKDWNEYPRKDDKAKAFKHYKAWIEGKKKSVFGKRKLTNEQILDAVDRYNDYLRKNNIPREYTKMGGTFFNEGLLNFIEEEDSG